MAASGWSRWSTTGPGHRVRNRIQDSFRPAGRRNRRVDPHPSCQSRFRTLPAACPHINPDTAFIYFSGTQAGIFAKQLAERGLGNPGIKIIGPADLTDDDDINTMGDQMLGINTSGSYSAAHGSALNKACVAAFEEASGFRPDFDWVGVYDGLHLIHEAFKKDERKRRWRHLD